MFVNTCDVCFSRGLDFVRRPNYTRRNRFNHKNKYCKCVIKFPERSLMQITKTVQRFCK